VTIQVRRDSEIYSIDGGWFRARWHFSFDRYRDPEQMGFGNMRVFNDDRLVPGAIWPLHPHRDVEGLTYVAEGLFGHEDDVGGDFGPLPAGSVQRMTLGRGANHSEQNADQDKPMRFIQVWIMPNELDLEPGVEQRVFTKEDRADRFLEAIGPDGGDAVLVHANARMLLSSVGPGSTIARDIPDGMGEYLYVIAGDVEVNGERMSTGDAARITDERAFEVIAHPFDADGIGPEEAGADGRSELIVMEVDLTASWTR
jgi:redox-sensitive bicupin YhaK (pirin superfamily)